MAKIDYNKALDGGYEPRAGDQYELSEGNWGTMRVPTKSLQEEVFALGDKATAKEVVDIVLKGHKSYAEDDAFVGMEEVVMRDFFALLVGIVKAVNPDFDPSEVAQPTEA